MSDPEPPPGTPGPTEEDARGVSPVVWIGLAALLIAGGIYAYSVFVPPEMPKDGMVEQTDEGEAFEGEPETPAAPAAPAEPAESIEADLDAEAEGKADAVAGAESEGNGDAAGEPVIAEPGTGEPAPGGD